MSLQFMYITNDLKIADICQKCGIERIWVDLEYKGKNERQRGMDSVKSKHTIEDVKKIRPVLTHSQLLVRVNPMDEESEDEINAVIEAGADIIMLPMAKSISEIEQFDNVIAGRCKKVLLLETREAAENIEAFLDRKIFDEVHIGLNDLSLSYNLKFMFQLLANGTVEQLCDKIRKYEIPYGFGGIAQLGKGLLPAEKIIPEHIRLHSTRAILSRSFYSIENMKNYCEAEQTIREELNRIRSFELSVAGWDDIEFEKNREQLVRIVDGMV